MVKPVHVVVVLLVVIAGLLAYGVIAQKAIADPLADAKAAGGSAGSEDDLIVTTVQVTSSEEAVLVFRKTKVANSPAKWHVVSYSLAEPSNASGRQLRVTSAREIEWDHYASYRIIEGRRDDMYPPTLQREVERRQGSSTTSSGSNDEPD